MKKLEKLNTNDTELSQVQDRILTVLNPIAQVPVLDGRLVTTALAAGPATTSVSHGLGRKLIGWQLVRKSANIDVWEATVFNNPEVFLHLTQSGVAASEVTLWVF